MNSLIFMQSDVVSKFVWAQRVLRCLTAEMRVIAVDDQDPLSCPVIGFEGDQPSYEHYGLLGFENFERLCVGDGLSDAGLINALSMAAGGTLVAWNVDLFAGGSRARHEAVNQLVRLCRVGLFSNMFVMSGGLQFGQKVSEQGASLVSQLQIESMAARWFPTDDGSIARLRGMAPLLACRLEAEKSRASGVRVTGSTWQVLTADKLLVHKVDEQRIENEPWAASSM